MPRGVPSLRCLPAPCSFFAAASPLPPRPRPEGAEPYLYALLPLQMPPEYTGRMLQYRLDRCVRGLGDRRGAGGGWGGGLGRSAVAEGAAALAAPVPSATCPKSQVPLPAAVPCCRSTCAWRIWEEGNTTQLHFDTYGIEVLMHEMMMQSDHRCEGGARRGELCSWPSTGCAAGCCPCPGLVQLWTRRCCRQPAANLPPNPGSAQDL
jgi:hypothetical protein